MTSLLVFAVLANMPPPALLDGERDQKAAERAKAVLAPFKKAMKETLTRALETSPEAAVEVCSKKAPELAKAAAKDGVVVGRAANRLRNPENKAPDWVVPVMEELSKAAPNTEASKVVRLPGGKRGYAEAIWVAEQCTLCHGANVTPQLDAKLKAAYPKDAARGYKPGDFRGVFWAEVSPAPARP